MLTILEDKNGKKTYDVQIFIKYKILDLSSKGITSAYQIKGSGAGVKAFSNEYDYGGSNVKISTTISFELVSHINRVNDNENVMFLVDDVGDGAIGEGVFGGQVNAVEVEQIGTRTPLDEIGHNFGFIFSWD